MEQKSRLEDLRIERPQKPPPGSAWLVVLLLLVAIVVGGSYWWSNRSNAVTVQTVAVTQSIGASAGERTVLNGSGYVTARRSATVSSKVTGKVIEVLIEEGLTVKEGDVLARLDDTNIKASLRLAEAQLGSATNALAETRVRIWQAEREFGRQGDLVRNKISTESEFDRAQAELFAYRARLEQQEADVRVAERQVAAWQQQLDDTVIRAPFSGIVTSKNAQPGEMISPISAGGGFTRTGICTIVDLESLEIEVDVNEGYINRVEPQQPVEAALDAYPQWKIPCKVIAIIPTADRQKSTVRVRVGFERLDPRILPEMSVKVAFRSAEKLFEGEGRGTSAASFSVPKAALTRDKGKDVVYVVREGKAERRAVLPQLTNGNDVVISSGLSGGERVVVNPPATLRDGMSVRQANGGD